jgi:hypothetical protein
MSSSHEKPVKPQLPQPKNIPVLSESIRQKLLHPDPKYVLGVGPAGSHAKA